jgi:hypothetical protein
MDKGRRRLASDANSSQADSFVLFRATLLADSVDVALDAIRSLLKTSGI